MGVSPNHAASVPLALSPSTGSITAQFHVVFDDWFATVASDGSTTPDFSSDEWNKMFGSSSFQYVLDDTEPTEEDVSSDANDFTNSSAKASEIESCLDRSFAPQPLSLSLIHISEPTRPY